MDVFPHSVKAAAILRKITEAVPSLELTWSSGPKGDWAGEMAVMEDEGFLGDPVVDDSMATLVRCGLLLRADLFDEPHVFCQAIPSATGSYWHGIVHRREPDFQNSRYWFRRVGDHPVFPLLFREVSSLAARPASEWRGEAIQKILAREMWDPFLFIDLCESYDRGSDPDLVSELECLQELEMGLLLRYSYEIAVKGKAS